MKTLTEYSYHNALRLNLSEFVWIWTHLQNLTVPRHHVRMCRFLAKLWKSKDDKNGLLMAFRNSGKSTIVGLFCAYVLWQNPDTRILILSADHELAKKMVRNIKRIIEKHPLTTGLKPAKKDQWASDCFTVTRNAHLRDPSVLARGLMANITGCRADLIICDDVEVPKSCDTSVKRQDLRNKLSELDYILTPGGMMLYVGTPHTVDTIYNTDADGFLASWESLKIPILTPSGKSNWPERFSQSKIAAIKKRSGPHKFASQMMLEAVQLQDSRLDYQKIGLYKEELSYSEANETAILKIGTNRLVSASAWWDPAFGAMNKGDDSVVACVFSDEKGMYYLHDIIYLRVPQSEESASFQCRAVADFVSRNYLPSIHLETNGIGKFLPALLRAEFARQRIACAVIEQTSRQNKAMRILSAFDALLMNGGLKAHVRLKQTPFFEQMQDWVPNGKTKDDALDAVAGCLLKEPVRLSGHINRYTNKKKEWRF